MKKMTDVTIGVDISKARLDVHRLSDGTAVQFGNDKAGFRAMRCWLEGRNIVQVIYEATGPYHRAFETALGTRFPLIKVNPLQARRFAQARGTRAKTDAVDARLLAEMGRTFDLKPQTVSTERQHALKELLVARQALIKARGRIVNRSKTLMLALLKRQSRAQIKLLKQQIKDVDAEIQTLLKTLPQTARAHDILCSIPGLSTISAAALLIEMPELGTLSKKQTASLAGLAPMTRQSGQWRGKSFIQGGRKHLRDALYMPALVAARHNPDLKAKYDVLVAAGKPKKVALIALMRKLIILANALIREDRIWAEKRT